MREFLSQVETISFDLDRQKNDPVENGIYVLDPLQDSGGLDS